MFRRVVSLQMFTFHIQISSHLAQYFFFKSGLLPVPNWLNSHIRKVIFLTSSQWYATRVERKDKSRLLQVLNGSRIFLILPHIPASVSTSVSVVFWFLCFPLQKAELPRIAVAGTRLIGEACLLASQGFEPALLGLFWVPTGKGAMMCLLQPP